MLLLSMESKVTQNEALGKTLKATQFPVTHSVFGVLPFSHSLNAILVFKMSNEISE